MDKGTKPTEFLTTTTGVKCRFCGDSCLLAHYRKDTEKSTGFTSRTIVKLICPVCHHGGKDHEDLKDAVAKYLQGELIP